MDLYGGSGSITQANAQTEAARQINEATRDFNNGLAEELDQANLEEDEDRQAKLQKNLLSGITAGGKLAAKKEIRPDQLIKGAKEGVFRKVSKAERFAREPAAPELGAASTLEEGEEITANVAGQTGEQTAEQTTARIAEREGTEGIETSGKALAKKAAEDAIEKAGLKTAGKIAGKAATFGKAGVAGLGGALDVAGDVGRLIEGKSGWDAFGSNSASRAGNIMNIVGSGLEVAGVLGAAFPPALILEGVGAAVGLAGAITEGFGEEEASEKAKSKAEKDITSQARGQVAADQVAQVVGRTQ